MDVPMQRHRIDDICPGVRSRETVVAPGSDLDLSEEAGGGEGDVDEEKRAFLDKRHGGERRGGGEGGGGRGGEGRVHHVVDFLLDGLVVIIQLAGEIVVVVVRVITRAGACPPSKMGGRCPIRRLGHVPPIVSSDLD